MWDIEANRLALLELWAAGSLRRRRAQAKAWDELDILPWTRRTTRRDELALVEDYRKSLEQMLDRVFPRWREDVTELQQLELDVDQRGYKELLDRRRLNSLPAALGERLNRRTALATISAHSKASPGEVHQEALENMDVTHDGLVRIRPNPGLVVKREEDRWDAQQLARGLGELILTERAFRDGTTFAGQSPVALLTVENLGAYIDLEPPPGWMVVHIPGWNTAMLHLLVERLPRTPLVHFGDLDPEGVRIVEHLRRDYPDLRWAVPPFWAEHIELRAQPCDWPLDLKLHEAPQFVQQLAADGIWLEQEAIAIDPRQRAYLEELLN